jgi:hypothetical protein
MKTYSAERQVANLLGVALLAVNLGHSALAEVFTIDSSRSSVTISGSLLGNTAVEQAPGSLTTTYAGTLVTALGAGTIQFTGQSVIQARTNGVWQPKADGSDGSEPANYGTQASSVLGTGKAALRSVQFDAVSPVINVVGGQFDASSLVFSFPTNVTSTLAYRVTGFIGTSGAKTLTGYATNKVGAVATLATVGSQQTLTIPLDATFVFTLVSSGDTIVNVKGQLVATRGATAPLTIGSIKVQAKTVTLQWQDAPGQQFQVRSSTNLNTWQTNASNVTSSTGTYTWSGAATAVRQFFRIVK